MNWNSDEILTNFTDLDSAKHKPFTIESSKLRIIPDGNGIGWFSDSKGTFCTPNVMVIL